MSSPPFDAEKYKVLMSGLECSEILLSQIFEDNSSFRIDAEYFYKTLIRDENKLLDIPHQYLKRKEIVSGPFGSTLTSDAYLVTGDIPFVRVENIKQAFHIDMQNLVYISKRDNERIIGSMLELDDIVMSKVGNSIGRFARVDTSVNPCNISENNIGIKLNAYPTCLKHYILCFFNSKYGYGQVWRRKSGNAQPKLNVQDLSEIPIPVFSEEFYIRISNALIISEKLRKKSEEQYRLAGKLLSHELGLDNWQPSKEKISVRSVAEVEQAGRWDAEYYQPKYDEILSLAQDVPNKRLGSIATIEKSIEPGSSAYQDEGIPFLRVQDLTIHGFGETEIHLDPIAFRDAPRVKADTILLTKDGTVGIAYKVEQDEDAITSGAILHLHLNDNDINPNYLTLVLNSPVVKLQAEQDAGGSVIQHWKPSEIEKVVIPLLPYAIQERISNKVQDAFKLRHQSRHLLNAAKRAVEIAIEEDENAALTYLSSQTDMFTDEEYSTDVSQPYLKVAEPEVGDNTNIDKGIKADERT